MRLLSRSLSILRDLCFLLMQVRCKQRFAMMVKDFGDEEGVRLLERRV